MRQRIVIAICMALDPKLVVMDEPTTALDVVVQREILQRINELRKEFGFSVLFITHDLGLMVQFCDRIGIMLSGRLVEQNTAEAIYRTPQHDYTKRLWASFPSLRGGVLL
jgi:peptide/nickel transport system ATP-binding protein